MINQDLQRAVGQTAQIEPWEIISGYDFGCIFYANRKCNLDGDFCSDSFSFFSCALKVRLG